MNDFRKVAYSWMFDCASWLAWKSFVKNDYDSYLKEQRFLLACVREHLVDCPERKIQSLVSRLMLRLAHGKHYGKFSDGDVDDGETTLEVGIECLKKLKRQCDHSHEEFYSLELEMITQAVYVCCRDDKFKLARNVCNNLKLEEIINSPNASTAKKAKISEILSVVDAADKKNRILKINSYIKFRLTINSLLEKIIKRIRRPFLFEVYNQNVAIAEEESAKSSTTVISSDEETVDKNSAAHLNLPTSKSTEIALSNSNKMDDGISCTTSGGSGEENVLDCGPVLSVECDQIPPASPMCCSTNVSPEESPDESEEAGVTNKTSKSVLNDCLENSRNLPVDGTLNDNLKLDERMESGFTNVDDVANFFSYCYNLDKQIPKEIIDGLKTSDEDFNFEDEIAKIKSRLKQSGVYDLARKKIMTSK